MTLNPNVHSFIFTRKSYQSLSSAERKGIHKASSSSTGASMTVADQLHKHLTGHGMPGDHFRKSHENPNVES